MLEMRYVGSSEKYVVNFRSITDTIIELFGNFPIKTLGFVLSRQGKEDNWDYSEYKTVYLEIEGGVQFSNDGSEYIDLPEFEPIPEPQPHDPTIEEVKAMKKQEIYAEYQAITTDGVDVELSTGTQHFPLSDEDRSFLMGKQIELSTGVKEVSYQDSNNRCMMLSSNDMQAIITAALAFVNMQTTYRNNLCEWIEQCETPEAIEAITYGIDIPEEYQNEVYKRYISQSKMEG